MPAELTHDLMQWGILIVGAIAAGVAWIGARRTRLKNVRDEHDKAIRENTEITQWRTNLEGRVNAVEAHAGEDGKVLAAVDSLREDVDKNFNEARTRESAKNEKLHEKIDKVGKEVAHLSGQIEGRDATLKAVREVMNESKQ